MVTAGVGGVTLTVDNPTAEVLTVRAGGASVLAVPGPSEVTLPLASGQVTVQCGSGTPVALTAQNLVAAAPSWPSPGWGPCRRARW